MALRQGETGSANEVVLVLVDAISPVVPPISSASSLVLRTAGISMSIWDIHWYQVGHTHPPIFVARTPGG